MPLAVLIGFCSPSEASLFWPPVDNNSLGCIDYNLFQSFVQLAGGTASMQQLKERLEKDLLEV